MMGSHLSSLIHDSRSFACRLSERCDRMLLDRRAEPDPVLLDFFMLESVGVGLGTSCCFFHFSITRPFDGLFCICRTRSRLASVLSSTLSTPERMALIAWCSLAQASSVRSCCSSLSPAPTSAWSFMKVAVSAMAAETTASPQQVPPLRCVTRRLCCLGQVPSASSRQGTGNGPNICRGGGSGCRGVAAKPALCSPHDAGTPQTAPMMPARTGEAGRSPARAGRGRRQPEIAASSRFQLAAALSYARCGWPFEQ
mmetsp:Transcript_17801/g.53343  ORF Transcript_17801/g.53343 Transcript_17801/m.53343 type:complete len:254 (+) Transcript_17801:2118-2879(+)